MQNKHNFLKFVLFIGDIILIYLALFLSLALRYGDFSFFPGLQTRVFLFHFSFIFLFWIFFLLLLDFYEIPPLKKVFDFLYNLILFLFLAGIIAITYFYLNPEALITPKIILVLNVLIFGVFLVGWRTLFNRILKFKNFKEKIIIIGSQSDFKDLSPELLNENGYKVIAFFDLIPSFEVSKLKEIIEKEKVDSIVFNINFHKNEKLIQEIFQNLSFKLTYINFSDFYENLTKKVSIENINEVWFLENFSGIERKINQLLKRSFDILFSIIGLLITIIFFPFIFLAIKIDSFGPIFYFQKRVGKEGRIFTIYKFRTMKNNAEKKGPQWAVDDDPRITSVGKVLRKLYLDEFPQFYNILKGDISFVGPRPERPEFVEQLKKEISYYDIRHLIKPGFTGWAQINYRYGSSVEDAREKLRYDFYYIKNRNFFLDLGIILKTIRIIFKK